MAEKSPFADFPFMNAVAPVAPAATPMDVVSQNVSERLNGLGFSPAQSAPIPDPIAEKKDRLSEISRAKQLSLNPGAVANQAAQDYAETELAGDPVYERIKSASYAQLVNEFGQDVADNRFRLLEDERDFLRSIGRDDRSWSEFAQDSATDVVKGGAGLVTGLASLGAGVVSDEAGVGIAQFGQELRENLSDLQSDSLNERMKNRQKVIEAEAQQNLREYDRESSVLEGGDSIEKKMRRVGKDWLDTMGNIVEDPAMFSSIAAEGVGSLGPSAVIAKGAAKAGARYGVQGVSVPAAIGGLEASGAHSQAVAEVMQMTEQELSIGSALYQELRGAGQSHEEARTQVANQAGLKAAAVQLPAAMVAGKFVQRFEVNPTKTTGLVDSLRTIGTQTLEEGFQEGSSSLAANVGIRNVADENRDIGEGVGEGTAQGMAGGLGQGVVAQGPGAALSATIETGKAVGQGAVALAAARRNQVQRDISAGGTTNTTAVAGVAETAEQDLTTLNEAQATSEESIPFVDRAVQTLGVRGDEMNEAPTAVKRLLVGDEDAPADLGMNRIDAMHGIIDQLESQETSAEQEEAAALWLYEQAQKIEALANEDVSSLPPQFAEIAQRSLAGVDTILSNPVVAKALERARSVDLTNMPELTDESVNTEEGRNNVSRTLMAASSNPAGIDPKFVDAILNQAAKGNLTLREGMVERLKAAKELAVGAIDADQRKAALRERTEAEVRAQKGGANVAIRKTVDIVRQEILTEGKNSGAQKGLSKHVSDIVGAVNQGDMQSAGVFMEALGNFAQHMQNKVAALEESRALNRGADNKISFRTWTGTNWAEAGSEFASSVYVNPNSPNSRMLAEEATIDAETVKKLYDSLSTIYAGQIAAAPLPAAPVTVEAAPTPEAEVQPEAAEAEPEAARAATKEPRNKDNPFKDSVVQGPVFHASRKDQPPVIEEIRANIASDGFWMTGKGAVNPERVGFYTTRNKEYAQAIGGEFLYEAFVNIRNPFLVPDGSDIEITSITTEQRKTLIEQGYDGLMYEDPNFRYEEIVTFFPDQVAWNATEDLVVLEEFDTTREENDSNQNIAEVEAESASAEELNIWAGTGENTVLSNLAPRKFTYEGREYFSVEHAYQTLKSGNFDPATYAKYDAKAGKKIVGKLGTQTSNSIQLMTDLVRASFEQNQNAAEALLATGNATLTHKQDRGIWSKEFPRILMLVRNELQNPNEEASSNVQVQERAESNESQEAQSETSQAEESRSETRAEQAPTDSDAAPIERDGENTGDTDNGAGNDRANEEAPQIPGRDVETTFVPAELAQDDNLETDDGYTEDSAVEVEGISEAAKAAYTFRPIKSRLMRYASPIAFVKDIYNGTLKHRDVELNYEINGNRLGTLSKLLNEQVEGLVDAMNAGLEKTRKGFGRPGGGGNISPLEAIQLNGTTYKNAKGETKTFEPLGLKQGRSLNLVDPETGKYSPILIETAAMAALDWVMNGMGSQSPDVEQTAKMFGIEAHLVTPQMLQAAQKGLNDRTAKEALAQHILKFWGAELNPEVEKSTLDGIVQSLAAEMLVQMEGKLVTSTKIEVGTNEKGLPIFATNIALSAEATEDDIRSLGAAKKFFQDLALTEKEKGYNFDQVPEDVVEKQKGNPFGKLGQKMRAALRRHQEVVFKRNTPFVSLMQALGEDAYKEMLGYREVDPEATNKVDLLSIEGKNTSLQSTWDNLMAFNEAMETHAEREGKTPEEVDVHFDVYTVSNERIHFAGFNPQANKGMREAVTATNATLDLTDPRQDDLFWITVAQSLGVKTEKGSRKANVAKAKEEAAKFEDSVEALRRWTEEGGELTAEEVATIKADVMAGEGTDKALHALLAVARYIDAQDTGGEAVTAFQHSLALEADGKTDGPINAMIHFLSGRFDTTQIRNMAKGGFYPGQPGMTLNQYAEMDSADLYETAAEIFKSRLALMKARVTGTPAGPQMDALINLMDELGLDIEQKDGELIIGRKVLKNPLTVTTYGSGKRGIAGKVTAGIMEAVYARLSETAAGNQDALSPQARKYLAQLTTSRAVFNRKADKWQIWSTIGRGNMQRKAHAQNFNDPVNVEFSGANQEMLLENVLTLFIDPMDQAINELMGNTKSTMELFQRATQVQSVIFMEKFKAVVKERVEAKRESGEISGNGFLTEKDYRQVFADLREYGVLVEEVDTNEHHINLSNKENAESDYAFSSSLDNDNRGNATMAGPSSAGVKVAPLLTISRGDAQMMVNYFAAEAAENDPRLKTLAVFDGLEMPADGIDELSEIINKASAEAWLENPAQDMADSFRNWVRSDPLKGMEKISLEALEQLRRALDRDDISFGHMPSEIQFLEERLAAVAMSIQARKNVYKRIAFSADHMASGETPYQQEGELSDVGSPEELIDGMNALYDEEVAKLREEKNIQETRPAVEAPTSEFRAKIEELGFDIGSGNIRELGAREVGILLKVAGASQDVQNVAAALAPLLPGFRFFFGDQADLQQLKERRNPFDDSKIELGQADLIEGSIYIANQSSETALHEMLHAVITKGMLEYYDGQLEADAPLSKAVENLEKLADQFLDLNLSNEPDNVREAASRTIREMQKYSGEDAFQKAARLSEFVAWTLSNQNLVDTLKKTRARTGLVRLISQALAGLRKMLGLSPTQRMDMFSNIAFNTGAIARLSDFGDGSPAMSLNQSAGKASDPRIRSLIGAFDKKIGSHLKALSGRERVDEKSRTAFTAAETLNHVVKAGFDLDLEQQAAFQRIQIALASAMQLDPKALVRVQKIYQTVMKDLTVESLMENPGPNETQADRAQAQEKFNEITGKYGSGRDPQDRTTLMSTFLALSQVDEQFRESISKMPLPERVNVESFKDAGMDAWLTSVATSMMNELSARISGEGKGSRTPDAALDKLTEALAKIEADERTQVEKLTHEGLSLGDMHGKKFLSKVGEKLVNWSESSVDAENKTIRSQVRAGLRAGARTVAGLIDETHGKVLARSSQSLVNQTRIVPIPLKEMMAEIIGITDENRGVYSLVNRAKYAVSALRQEHREVLPEVLAEEFSRELKKPEWEQLHLALGKTDIASLAGSMSGKQIRDILTDPAARKRKIADLMESITNLGSAKNSKLYRQKAEELAKFMVSGEIDPTNDNFLRNAWAIANLMGETSAPVKVSDALVEDIDQLTTLLAIDLLGKDTTSTVNDLALNEPKGVDFVMRYLADLRAKEVEKQRQSSRAQLNGYKGYIPAERRQGASMRVSDDKHHDELIARGYVRMGDYEGAGIERGKKGYYYSTVAGKATYNQGVLQTVQHSAMGVDPKTGRTLTGNVAGHIDNSFVKVITHRLKTRHYKNRSGEVLMPVYDIDGSVIGYERHMKPEMLNRLSHNTRLDEMIGAWAGRQAEEQLSDQFNQTLVDRIKEQWDAGRAESRRDEYVNLATSTDPVHKDAWGIIPAETKAYIEDVFGEDRFMIREDMINNAVGYRQASVTDNWEENNRVSPAVRDAIVDLSTLVMGKNAFKYMATTEKGWQTVVSVAKNTIVIRSVIVPASNMASNVVQLMINGVPLRNIMKGMPEKLVEIDQHLKNERRVVELKAQLAQVSAGSVAARKLNAEIQSRKDASRRMSIWPLIEAGEFSTISEGLTDMDAAIGEGRWVEKMEELAERIPQKLGTFGRYAFVTRDTALFKGMSRAVQYGDFLAKAVLYEDMVKRQKTTKSEALKKVEEEFVNYNLLPGRTRSYAESMGLTWFWAYKLRSIKIAHRHMRDNPLRALLGTVGMGEMPNVPGVSVGSPITDNMASVIMDDRLGYSMGPGMLFNAPSLNPWWNLAN